MLIDVAEQVKWFHAHIRSVNHALGETPEILIAVRVNFAPDVLNRVIYDLMRVFRFQTVIRKQRIREQRRASRNVFLYLSLKRFLLAVLHNHGFYPAVRSLALVATLKHSEYGCLVYRAGASDAPGLDVLNQE